MANLLGTLITGNLRTTQGYGTSDSTRILYPGGGSFVTTTSTITGAIRIKMPVFGSGMMMTCTVKVYEYSTNKSFTITFGGHRDSANWYNEFCYIDGGTTRTNLTVRFGIDDGVNCVWIGETSSSWSYPQVFVTDAQLGYVGYSTSWLSGWAVDFVTAFGSVARTQVAYAKITGANIGSQSVSFATTSDTFSTGWTNYKGVTENAVSGQLMWKNYGNNHTIFDASNSTSPTGSGVNNTNSDIAWTGTYPTLMGWNGSSTYGVRVDSARVADSAGSLTSMNISQFTNNSGYITGISFANVSSKPTTISGYGITDALYQNRDTINVDAFNATGLYRGSTSGWSNRPTIAHNGGALLTIDTHPSDYHSQLFFDTGGDRLYLRNANAGTWGSWLTIIHSGNIGSQSVSYATSAGSAGSASTAGYSDEAKWISYPDGPRDLSDRSPIWNNRSVAWDFVGAGTANGSGNYGGVMTFVPWDGTSASTGDSSYQLAFANTTGVNASGQPKLSIRNGINSTWNAWYTLIHSGNIGSQSVSYATSAGSAGTAGSAGSVDGLTLTSSANNLNPDNVTQNQIGYNTSVSLFGQTDGGLYSSAYSSSWIHQIFGDFRTGQIAIRGKNSGTWGDWRIVVDDRNIGSYAVPYGNMTSSTGLNDNKLYLRTNGDNNHYLWNAADDWEEMVYYNGTGFRVKGSTGTVSATFTDSGISIGTSSTSIRSFDAQGYLRIYGSSTNYLGIGPYNNNGWVYFENLGNASGIYFNSPGRYAFDSVDVTPYNDNENSLGNGSYRWANIYTGGWLRNYGAQGIYNESYGTHFYSNGGGDWSITGSGAGVALAFRSNHQSTIRGYVHADTSNQIGFLNNGGGWSFRTNSSLNAFVHGPELTINADGASYSNIIMNDGDEGARTIHCNSNRIGFLTQGGSWGSWCGDDGSWSSDVAIYAPVFYDSQNSGFYLDPNNTGTSLNIAGGIVTTAPGGSVLLKHAVSEADAWIFQENAANWGLYWKNLSTGNHTFGGYTTVGAELFGMSAANTSGNGVLTTNFVGATAAYAQYMLSNFTGYIWSASTIFAAGDMRAPIFYDSNDTTYFLDPNADFAMRVYGEICNSNYAEGKMQPGALNIGRTDLNYAWEGGSWAGDVRVGILANTSETWEIAVHDSGDSVKSLIHFDGGSTITMGRDIGWSTCVVNSPSGYVSNGNPWGTANSAFFPNGITTAGSSNWIYGTTTYIGNAPSNGAGHEFSSSGTQYSTGSITTPLFLVNGHSDNTKGYRIHNTSGSSVSAMFTNSSNQLVIAAGAVDQINLNKKVYVNAVALGVNIAPSATAGRIDASNDIVAYSSSDERLKQNITPIANALDKVKSLTGVEFDWKPEHKEAHGHEGHDTGIIAQQVLGVMPTAVRTNDTGYLAVRYEKLIGLLIEGMKEQQSQIEELKAKLDGLTK